MPGPSHRIVFAGTPDFAVPALDALLAAGHEVAAVYTQPDRRAGRGRRLSAPPVKRRALAAGIPVYQPESLRTAAAQQQLRALKPDVLVVVAYGLLLPQAVLDIPARGCLNIHASLLPRWRGAAPVQRALQAGDAHTGISIMQMEAGLDTGPVLLVRETAIRPEDTGGSLHDRLAALGGEAIVAALADPDALTPRPQDESRVTYARKLTKAEARLDWQRPAAELARDVRAFNPWPVCFTQLDNETLRVWEARAQPGDGGFAPGTVVAVSGDGLRVAAGGDSELVLTRVQAPGGRPLAVRDFLNAHPVGLGTRLT